MTTRLRALSALAALLLAGWVCFAGPTSAQGPLLLDSREAGPPQPCIEVRVDRSLEGAGDLEQLLRAYGSLEGQVDTFGDIVTLRFADVGAAVRFLQAIGPAVHELPAGGSPWAELGLKFADPRHVRALIGTDILARGVPAAVRCVSNPPRVLINGPASEVQRWRLALEQLDVPAPQNPSPEDVVRMYLERWLIVPDDGTGPDYSGMHALTTQSSRDQIGLPEFSAIISRSLLVQNQQLTAATDQANAQRQQILGSASGFDAEISGVYPANVSPNGRMAVVAYSVTWFGAPTPGPIAQAGERVPAQSWVSARRAEAEARRNQLRANSQATAQVPPGYASGRVAVAVYRSYGLVVREADGIWRIPMVFDEDARTWLTPLSPTLPDRIAPALVPRSEKLGGVP